MESTVLRNFEGVDTFDPSFMSHPLPHSGISRQIHVTNVTPNAFHPWSDSRRATGTSATGTTCYLHLGVFEGSPCRQPSRIARVWPSDPMIRSGPFGWARPPRQDLHVALPPLRRAADATAARWKGLRLVYASMAHGPRGGDCRWRCRAPDARPDRTGGLRLAPFRPLCGSRDRVVLSRFLRKSEVVEVLAEAIEVEGGSGNVWANGRSFLSL